MGGRTVALKAQNTYSLACVGLPLHDNNGELTKPIRGGYFRRRAIGVCQHNAALQLFPCIVL
jgi:hypothetical protein